MRSLTTKSIIGILAQCFIAACFMFYVSSVNASAPLVNGHVYTRTGAGISSASVTWTRVGSSDYYNNCQTDANGSEFACEHHENPSGATRSTTTDSNGYYEFSSQDGWGCIEDPHRITVVVSGFTCDSVDFSFGANYSGTKTIEIGCTPNTIPNTPTSVPPTRPPYNPRCLESCTPGVDTCADASWQCLDGNGGYKCRNPLAPNDPDCIDSPPSGTITTWSNGYLTLNNEAHFTGLHNAYHFNTLSSRFIYIAKQNDDGTISQVPNCEGRYSANSNLSSVTAGAYVGNWCRLPGPGITPGTPNPTTGQTGVFLDVYWTPTEVGTYKVMVETWDSADQVCSGNRQVCLPGTYGDYYFNDCDQGPGSCSSTPRPDSNAYKTVYVVTPTPGETRVCGSMCNGVTHDGTTANAFSYLYTYRRDIGNRCYTTYRDCPAGYRPKPGTIYGPGGCSCIPIVNTPTPHVICGQNCYNDPRSTDPDPATCVAQGPGYGMVVMPGLFWADLYGDYYGGSCTGACINGSLAPTPMAGGPGGCGLVPVHPPVVITGVLKEYGGTNSCTAGISGAAIVQVTSSNTTYVNTSGACTASSSGYQCSIPVLFPTTSPMPTFTLSLNATADAYQGGGYWTSANACVDSSLASNTYTVTTSGTHNKDIFFNNSPWIKLKNAAFVAIGALTNTIPNSATAYDSDDTTTSVFNLPESGVVSISSTTNMTSANTSDKGWLHSNYSYSPVMNPATFLEYARTKTTVNEISSLDSLQTGKVNVLTPGGGTLTIGSSDIAKFNDKKVVIVVSGNVSITATNFNPTNASVALIVNGSLTLDPTTTELNGLFVANSVSLGTTANQGLKVKGNLISRTTMANTRRWTTTSKPSVFIVFDPSVYLNVMDVLSVTLYNWKQLQ